MPPQDPLEISPAQSSLIGRVLSRVREYGLADTMRHTAVVLMHRSHTAIEKTVWRHPNDHEVTYDKIDPSNPPVKREKETGSPHVPTPWMVLKWVNDALPADKSNWSFVDLGAGEGRAMLAAADHPYKQIIGVEFVEELAERARSNINSATKLNAGSLGVACCDASEFDYPLDPMIVFMFNPFDQPVINRVAEVIAASYASSPRPVIIAYLNPKHDHVFAALKNFKRYAIPANVAQKFRFLSPYKLHMYATREALPLL